MNAVKIEGTINKKYHFIVTVMITIETLEPTNRLLSIDETHYFYKEFIAWMSRTT